jgi:hypothetical protein
MLVTLSISLALLGCSRAAPLSPRLARALLEVQPSPTPGASSPAPSKSETGSDETNANASGSEESNTPHFEEVENDTTYRYMHNLGWDIVRSLCYSPAYRACVKKYGGTSSSDGQAKTEAEEAGEADSSDPHVPRCDEMIRPCVQLQAAYLRRQHYPL